MPLTRNLICKQMKYLIYSPDCCKHQLCQSSPEVYRVVREWLPPNNQAEYVIVYDMAERSSQVWYRNSEGLLEIEDQ